MKKVLGLIFVALLALAAVVKPIPQQQSQVVHQFRLIHLVRPVR